MPGMRFSKGGWWATRGPSKTSSKVPEISAFSLNMNGINRTRKRNVLSTMRRDHDWGLLLLSDTRIHDARELKNLDKSLGCKDSVWSLGTPNGGGIAILFFKPVIVTAQYSDPGGHFLRADFVWENEEFSVICIYAPADSGRRKKFFLETLKSHLERCKVHDKCIIRGNFKFVENPFYDRTSQCQGGTSGLDQWNEATDILQPKDSFRHFHPRKRTYTFNSSEHKMHSRIDRIYSSNEALSFVATCKHVTIPSIISDHIAGVEVSIRDINCATRGPSYWKLNVSLMCH
jgi:exonuclease III